MTDTGNIDPPKATPPYVAFPTFKTLLKSFQEHGIPGRIDRSVFPSFSGSVAGQLIPALRFLGLINAGNQPTETLKTLVATYDTPNWSEEFRVAIKDAYGALSHIDMETASPSQFNEAFSKAYPGAENVVRKCKTFYLAAAAEAKIPISPYIMRNKKPRTGSTKKRAAKTNVKQQSNHSSEVNTDQKHQEHATRRPLSEQVLAILDMKNLTQTEENAVFALLKFLRKEGK